MASYGMVDAMVGMPGASSMGVPDLSIPLIGSTGSINSDGYAPGLGTVAGVQMPDQSGLGFNMPTAQLALSGLGTLGGLWSAFQGLGLAKKQYRMQKEFGNININNQIKSYNTALEDKARSRGVVEGQSAADTQKYIDLNRLSR